MNARAKFAEVILRKYAKENGVLPRSTSDLSKLEEWLILQLFSIQDNPEDPGYKLLDSQRGTMDQVLSELVEKCPECKGPARWYWNEQNVQYRLHCSNPRCSWFREPIKAKDPSGITLLKMGKKPIDKSKNRGGICPLCNYPTRWQHLHTSLNEMGLFCSNPQCGYHLNAFKRRPV